MASRFEVTVVSLPAIDEVISVSDSISGTDLFLIFKAVRSAIGEVTIGVLGDGIDHQVSILAKGYSTFYNNFSLYTVVMDFPNNKVIITAINLHAATQFALVTNTTAGAITIAFFNDAPASTFTIDTVALSAATVGVPCDDVKLTVTTTPQADNITSPISQSVATNPFIFETVRGNEIDITMDFDSVAATFKARIPLLLTANISIDIEPTPSGGIVIVNRLYPLSQIGPTTYPLLLTFEYRMDIGGFYQVANSWSGISAGAHTVYIKDQIGCEINIPITVPAFSANLVDFDPVFEISNVNAFRFKLNEIWDTECGIRRKVSNTLSFEEDTKINHRNYLQPFQKCDSPNTQVKTNYDTVAAALWDCDGLVAALSVVQMTENMNVKDLRDGRVKVLPGNILGIYFGSGNTWDPDSPATQIGSYNLLENLMDWVNVGDYMSVEGVGWLKVTKLIQPTSSFSFYVVELNATNDLSYADDTVLKITTIYNVVDYDRHEFITALASRSGNYYIKVNGTDATFPAKEFISEWFNVQTVQKGCHKIEWFSTKNNEINYGTAITYVARFAYVMNLKWKPNDEQEIYVTDTQTIHLDSKVREFYELNLLPLPTAMAQKVVLILAHNRIFIEGQSYLLEGEVESKSFGTTNLYAIKANLVRTDYVFDSTKGTTAGEILLGSGVPLQIDAGADGLLWIE